MKFCFFPESLVLVDAYLYTYKYTCVLSRKCDYLKIIDEVGVEKKKTAKKKHDKLIAGMTGINFWDFLAFFFF